MRWYGCFRASFSAMKHGFTSGAMSTAKTAGYGALIMLTFCTKNLYILCECGVLLLSKQLKHQFFFTENNNSQGLPEKLISS
jgi:hypothetical protein